jgi:hypothetical protein
MPAAISQGNNSIALLMQQFLTVILTPIKIYFTTFIHPPSHLALREIKKGLLGTFNSH